MDEQSIGVQKKKSKKKWIILTLAILGFLGYLMFRSVFPIITYLNKGEAMSPTIKDGEAVALNKLDQNYERKDIVVIILSESTFSIKRIIGLPGENIEIKEGKVFIDGKEIIEDYVTGETHPSLVITLKDNEYYVLGDNRPKSADSRKVGSIQKKRILGKTIYEEGTMFVPRILNPEAVKRIYK